MLINHSLIYTLSKIVPGLVAFVTLSIYTHLLTPEEYGLYTLLLSGAVFVQNLFIDWLSNGTLRFWSNKNYSNEKFTNTLIYILIKLALLLFVITLLLFLFFWGKEQVIWIVSICFLVISLGFFTISQTLTNVKEQPLNYAYTTITYSLLALTFGSIFAYLEYGAIGVIVGITLGTAISSLLMLKKNWDTYDRSHVDKSLINNFFKYGIPIALATFVEELTILTDKFMIAFLQGKEQTGLYAVSYDLTNNTILMIMGAISLAAYPIIVKLLETKGKQKASDYINNYLILLLGISIPSLIGLNLVGEELIKLVLDKKYHDSTIALLPWISASSFLLGIQFFYLDLAFQLSFKTQAHLKISLFAFTINLILNYFLIPIWGIKGAAIATLVSFALGNLLSLFLGRKYYILPFPLKEFFKIVASCLIMAFVIIFLKSNSDSQGLFIQIISGTFTYFMMIYLFNVYNVRSKRPIKTNL